MVRVKHPKTASQPGDLDCSDWNSDHEFAEKIQLADLDEVKLMGYTLVEEKVLPAGTTSCVFDGLNGDEDGEYLLEYELSSADGKYQTLYLNNDTGSNYAGVQLYAWRGGTGANDLPTAQITAYESQSGMLCTGRCTIHANSGKYRVIDCDSVITGDYSSLPIMLHRFVQWKNVLSNITSLVISHQDADNGFSGKIRLWKRIPVNGGG